jgi:hypothetical protein
LNSLSLTSLVMAQPLDPMRSKRTDGVRGSRWNQGA